MRFSERIGKAPLRAAQQSEDIDELLRNGLWNLFYKSLIEPFCVLLMYVPDWAHPFLQTLWHDFFKWPIDRISSPPMVNVRVIRDWFFNAPWYSVYDLIEFLIQTWPKRVGGRDSFINDCNTVLQREQSAWRVLNEQVVQITDSAELEEVGAALENAKGTKFALAGHHLQTALRLLFDRKQPDYRNAMKESISAVEAATVVVASKPRATLGDAIKVLGAAKSVHPALLKAFNALYGYSNDAGGIRHALIDEPSANFVDAKFFFIACSAFVNYLIARAATT